MLFFKIDIKSFPRTKLNFTNINLPKDYVIKNYLIDWVKDRIENNIPTINGLLPKKNELASYFGVSIGTIQNAIRHLEDSGYVQSKQKIGTVITFKNNDKKFRKSTSKREKLVILIKKFILSKNLNIGDILPSIRQFSLILNSSVSTTRMALELLAKEGIIVQVRDKKNNNEVYFKVISEVNQSSSNMHFNLSSDTLVSKTQNEILNFIIKNLKVGDKLPSHKTFAKQLNVSEKTINFAVKKLEDIGMVVTKRGKYGTFVLNIVNCQSKFEQNETQIYYNKNFYDYEKVQIKIYEMIKKEYELGDKLPSIKVLAKKYSVSQSTIRKALKNLNKQSIVQFSQGRLGGTFVSSIIDEDDEFCFSDTNHYKWVLLNSSYIDIYKNHQQ